MSPRVFKLFKTADMFKVVKAIKVVKLFKTANTFKVVEVISMFNSS